MTVTSTLNEAQILHDFRGLISMRWVLRLLLLLLTNRWNKYFERPRQHRLGWFFMWTSRVRTIGSTVHFRNSLHFARVTFLSTWHSGCVSRSEKPHIEINTNPLQLHFIQHMLLPLWRKKSRKAPWRRRRFWKHWRGWRRDMLSFGISNSLQIFLNFLFLSWDKKRPASPRGIHRAN